MLFEYLEKCGDPETYEERIRPHQVPGCLRQRHCLRNCTCKGKDITADLEKAVKEYRGGTH